MTNGTRGRNESSVPTGDIFPRVTRLMIRLYAVARTHASRHFFFSFSFFFFRARAPKGATAKGAALGNVGLVGTQRCLYSPLSFSSGSRTRWDREARNLCNCPQFLSSDCWLEGLKMTWITEVTWMIVEARELYEN